MSLFGVTDKVPEYLIISLINSTFMSKYVDSFVNNTQTFQINDARQLPVVIPNIDYLAQISNIFHRALLVKQTTNNGTILDDIQKSLDYLVESLYLI